MISGSIAIVAARLNFCRTPIDVTVDDTLDDYVGDKELIFMWFLHSCVACLFVKY
jgi:hypothetical protein